MKTRPSKKGHEAEQSTMNRVCEFDHHRLQLNTLPSCAYSFVLFQASSPQTGSQQSGGTLKSLKDKFSKEEKEVPEASGLKTAGPEGEITAGLHQLFYDTCHYIDLEGASCPSFYTFVFFILKIFRNRRKPTMLIHFQEFQTCILSMSWLLKNVTWLCIYLSSTCKFYQ